MSVVVPVGCSKFPFGCMCRDCALRDAWNHAQPSPRLTAVGGGGGGGGGNASSATAGSPRAATTVFYQWVPEELQAIGQDEGTRAPPTEKLPPMNCTWCQHRNEFVGPEHLVNGQYVCRQCRPRLGLKVVGT